MPASLILRHARLATCSATRRPVSRDSDQLGMLDDGALICRDGRILFVGPDKDLPPTKGDSREIDCAGRLVTPGLIDCHTHLVHGGDRAEEFEQRLRGASYEEIARAGGGIISTVRATRQASEDDLVAASSARLDDLLAEGVTTVEIKSGYGLDLDTEIKQLRVARRLGSERHVRVCTTYLGAHALPPEMKQNRTGYVAKICDEVMPAVAAAGLADAVDGFCESIAFTPDEISRVFSAAQRHGLKVKLHADQLSNLHGAALAASFHALSADHLEHTDEAGVKAMAERGTVAVLLPGAFYFVRETKVPPVELFRRHGVPMALATDCNPGSSPLTSPLLAMNMAATLFRMTVDECLLGLTRHGAEALGLDQQCGTLDLGKAADCVIWDAERPAELVYRIGHNPLHKRIFAGAEA